MANAAQVKRWLGFGACALVVGACSFAAFLQMAVPGQEPEPVIAVSRTNGAEASADVESVVASTTAPSASDVVIAPVSAASPAAPATGAMQLAAASASPARAVSESPAAAASSAKTVPTDDVAVKKSPAAKSKRAKAHKSRTPHRRRALAFLPMMRRLERFPMREFMARRFF